jgi:hypothetical protein
VTTPSPSAPPLLTRGGERTPNLTARLLDLRRRTSGIARATRTSHRWAALGAALLLPAVGLPLDARGGIGTQLAVGVAAWLAAIAVIEASRGELRRRLVACLAISTAGEIFLSLVWGLYDYRLGGVPLFVPPGHLLVMTAGIVLADTLKTRWLTPTTVAAALALAAHAAWTRLGTLDLALVALLLGCLALARSSAEVRLYSVMFWLALALELCGTALGNWRWRASEDWLGLTSGNPPLAAGAFYCALDLLCLVATRGRATPRRRPVSGLREAAWVWRGLRGPRARGSASVRP